MFGNAKTVVLVDTTGETLAMPLLTLKLRKVAPGQTALGFFAQVDHGKDGEKREWVTLITYEADLTAAVAPAPAPAVPETPAPAATPAVPNA